MFRQIGHPRRHGFFAFVACLVLAALLVPGVAAASATTPAPDAQALLQKAATTMSEVKSFHFALSNENGSTPLMEGVNLDSADGDVVVPNKFQAEITADLKGISLTVKIVGIGSDIWLTNPMTGKFQKLPGGMAPVAALFNPYAILSAATKTLQNPKITGSEKIDGVATTKVAGQFAFGPSVSATPAARSTQTASPPLTITLWIDAQGQVRRLQLSGPLLPSDPPDVVRTFDLTNFGQKVNIQAPSES